MQPKKPLSEYTVAGLLYIGAQTNDDAVKSAVLNELRNRQRAAELRKEAADRNREEKKKLSIELEIEGLQSRDKQIRRAAKRSLFALMKDKAFEIIDIPEGMLPADAVKRYNHDIHDKASELYREFRLAHKDDTLRSRRAEVEGARKEYQRERQKAKRLRQIETAAYQAARFPLVGAAVYYTDTKHAEKQLGTIRGYTFSKLSCAFLARIETAEGSRILRTLQVIEPVENADWFNDVRASFLEFEKWEKIVRERDGLKLRVEIFSKRIAELDDEVNEYMQSDFRRNWLAADEVARNFARDARNVETDALL